MHPIVFPDRVRVGIPDVKALCFFGNAAYENTFYEYLDALSGMQQVELKSIDFAPSQSDHALMGVAAMIRNVPFSACTRAEDRIELAVCGAHMRGLPLSKQWSGIGGKYVRELSTAPAYRMICLHHKDPIRPGLVRCPQGADGASLEMELWSLPVNQVGRFLSMIEEPLGLGSIETADGRWVHGFICEAAVASLPSSEDITHHGSWRRFLASKDPEEACLESLPYPTSP